jgi:hypothetical protein
MHSHLVMAVVNFDITCSIATKLEIRPSSLQTCKNDIKANLSAKSPALNRVQR